MDAVQRASYVIVVHCVSKGLAERSAETAIVARKTLEPAEPVPPGAIWIDMIEPTLKEDQKVQAYLGCEIPTRSDPDYKKISNIRESMVSIERLLRFPKADDAGGPAPKPLRDATNGALRDLQSLEEDASFKAQKVQFLLDATLGLINLAQNDIIKLFSVLAVIFMPPTVIASIYGMNFRAMPELEWAWGYPLAVVLMIAAAIVPYVFFRWKKWL